MRTIRWTERSEEHIARHEVSPVEVTQVLRNRPLSMPGRAQTVENEARTAVQVFGVTDAGRHLFVVLSPDPGGETAFVITARPMTAKEKRAYQHREGDQDEHPG